MQEGFTVLGEGRIINTETQKPIKIKFVDNNNNQNIKIEQNNKPQNEKIIQNRNERQINGLNIKTPKGIEHVSSIEEVKQIAKRDQVIISLINGYKVYPDGKILDKDNNIATNIRSFSDLYNLDFKEQEISNKQSQETNQTENNTQSSDITEAINTIPKGKGKILKIGNGHAEIYKIKKKGRVVKIKKKGEMGVISGN